MVILYVWPADTSKLLRLQKGRVDFTDQSITRTDRENKELTAARLFR